MPKPSSTSSFLFQTALAVSLVVGVVLYAVYLGTPITRSPDSLEYLAYVQYIQQGSWLSAVPQGELFHPLIIRTMGYPLLLALSAVLVPFPMAVVTTHLFVALFALVMINIACRRLLPAALATLAVFLAASMVWRFFFTTLTEWSAACMYLAFFAALVQTLQQRSIASYALLCALSTACFLIRPALIVVFLLPFALLFTYHHRRTRALVFGILVGIPLFLLSVLNFSRTGALAPTAYGAMSLFGVTVQLNAPSVQPDDDQALAHFIYEVVKRRNVAINDHELVEVLTRVPVSVLDQRYSENFCINVQQIVREMNLSHQEALRLMRTYAIRVLLAHPTSYLHWVAHGLMSVKIDLLIALLSLPFLAFVYARLSEPTFALVAGLALLLHVAHILMCSLLVVPIERYVDVTRTAAVCMGICLFARLLGKKWLTHDSTDILPPLP